MHNVVRRKGGANGVSKRIAPAIGERPQPERKRVFRLGFVVCLLSILPILFAHCVLPGIRKYYFDTVEFGGVAVIGILLASAWSALA